MKKEEQQKSNIEQTAQDEAAQEQEVAREIVQALSHAHQDAVESGKTIVFVRDRQLVRQHPDGTIEVLKTLPPRPKVQPPFIDLAEALAAEAIVWPTDESDSNDEIQLGYTSADVTELLKRAEDPNSERLE